MKKMPKKQKGVVQPPDDWTVGRASGLREAAEIMERVIGFGVMRIPVVGMAETLREKARAIERGEDV